MPLIHVYVPEATLSPEQKRALIERATTAAEAAEGVPVADRTWVLVHELPPENWGERGAPLAGGPSRPIVEISTPVGWVTMARKREMVRLVAGAVAEATGAGGVHYVIVNEVPDGGWGWEGRQIPRARYQPHAAPDLPADAAPDGALAS